MSEVATGPGSYKVSAQDDRIGTFRDSLRAPIHRWFSYPVGFSPAFVDRAITEEKLSKGDRLYDPFAGTATSLVTARLHGIESHGLESHPFIHFVGATKLRWECVDGKDVEDLIAGATAAVEVAELGIIEDLPSLLHSCYEPTQLARLVAIRDHVRNTVAGNSVLRGLGELAIASIARSAANVSTKWPYLAPKQKRSKSPPDALALFKDRLRLMSSDLNNVANRDPKPTAVALVENADARLPHPYLTNGSVDLVVTSAPYLNNFDYADRTRLETYLLGYYSSWGEISQKVRSRLMVSATTQVGHATHKPEDLLSCLKATDPSSATLILGLVNQVCEIRRLHRRKKQFDLMMAAYFSDMFRILSHTRPLLKNRRRMLIILGDSALFGVYIPTHEIVGRLGIAAGFSSFRVTHLRSRGNKWRQVRDSRQIPLMESLVILTA